METTEERPSIAQLPIDELEAEISRRRQQQYPSDIEQLVANVKVLAAHHKVTPRKLLEDCAKKLQKKRFVPINPDEHLTRDAGAKA